MKVEILRMEHIFKKSLGVKILDDFKLNVFKGEIVSIIGLSGSGKTVLTNILAGIENMDSGLIYFNEEKFIATTKLPIKKMGIFCIHHETMMSPNLSVSENLFVIWGKNLKKTLVNKKAVKNQAKFLLDKMCIDISPDTLAKKLSLAEQHNVELVKAFALGVKIIVIDDITDSYKPKEIEKLKELICLLRDEGISIIFQSHKPDSISELADRVMIMSNGKNVKTIYADEYDNDYIYSLLVGREFSQRYERTPLVKKRIVLEVMNICSEQLVKDISFSLNRGEILGIIDLEDKANNNIANILTGQYTQYSGVIKLDGINYSPKDLQHSIKCKVGFIPQGSAETSLLLNLSIAENLSIMVLEKTRKCFFCTNKKVLKYISQEYMQQLGININKQKKLMKDFDSYIKLKVLLYRWLLYNPKVLVYIKPFAGADLIMKEIIYSSLDKAVKNGMGIVVTSSDLSELSSICDRILVLTEGKISKEYKRDEFQNLNL